MATDKVSFEGGWSRVECWCLISPYFFSFLFFFFFFFCFKSHREAVSRCNWIALDFTLRCLNGGDPRLADDIRLAAFLENGTLGGNKIIREGGGGGEVLSFLFSFFFLSLLCFIFICELIYSFFLYIFPVLLCTPESGLVEFVLLMGRFI